MGATCILTSIPKMVITSPILFIIAVSVGILKIR